MLLLKRVHRRVLASSPLVSTHANPPRRAHLRGRSAGGLLIRSPIGPPSFPLLSADAAVMLSSALTSECPLVVAAAVCAAAGSLLPALVQCGKVRAGAVIHPSFRSLQKKTPPPPGPKPGGPATVPPAPIAPAAPVAAAAVAAAPLAPPPADAPKEKTCSEKKDDEKAADEPKVRAPSPAITLVAEGRGGRQEGRWR